MTEGNCAGRGKYLAEVLMMLLCSSTYALFWVFLSMCQSWFHEIQFIPCWIVTRHTRRCTLCNDVRAVFNSTTGHYTTNTHTATMTIKTQSPFTTLHTMNTTLNGTNLNKLPKWQSQNPAEWRKFKNVANATSPPPTKISQTSPLPPAQLPSHLIPPPRKTPSQQPRSHPHKKIRPQHPHHLHSAPLLCAKQPPASSEKHIRPAGTRVTRPPSRYEGNSRLSCGMLAQSGAIVKPFLRDGRHPGGGLLRGKVVRALRSYNGLLEVIICSCFQMIWLQVSTLGSSTKGSF